MRKSILILFLMTILLSMISFGKGEITFSKDIKNVTAITEPSGSGELFTAIAIEYKNNVDKKSLTKDTFSVEGRTVVNIYTNDRLELKNENKNGKYIIIELDKEEEGAVLRIQGSGRTSGFSFNILEPEAKITQKSDIIFTNGKKYNSGIDSFSNNNIKRLIVDDFKQFEYRDIKTGVTVKYNLYIPKNYNKNKKYPLVMFLHDASVQSNITTATLRQGNGATVWATPEEQEKREAFVLAPQYSTQIVNDKSEYTLDLDATVNLLTNLMKTYSIDKNRLYTTGQSMGGMMSIVMNYKYPDLFTGSYLVACQWDYSVVSPMSKNNIWITVSTGDLKAYPGMNAITTVFEQNGGIVSRGTWRGDFTKEQFNSGVKEILLKNPSSNIKYTTLEKGTIPGVKTQQNSGGAEHVYTWRVAYNIEGIREWLFTQKK